MLIETKNLTHIYGQGTPYEKKALDDVSIAIEKGEYLSIIGHTGSGKSTLIQHLNGLLEPSSGRVIVDGQDLSAKSTKLSDIRRKVGLVFQYPEHQIFEETVEKDISFAAVNSGLGEDETIKRVKKAMEMVGLDYETYKDLAPLDLSGGEKRRVAIAGILVMDPEVLILDEPTAGLDPAGRKEILEEIKDLHESYDMTIVLVSHSMDEVAKYVQRIIVMDKGQVFMDDKPINIFKYSDDLRNIGLDIPQVTNFMEKLKACGADVRTDIITLDEAVGEIERYLRSKENVR